MRTLPLLVTAAGISLASSVAAMILGLSSLLLGGLTAAAVPPARALTAWDGN